MTDHAFTVQVHAHRESGTEWEVVSTQIIQLHHVTDPESAVDEAILAMYPATPPAIEGDYVDWRMVAWTGTEPVGAPAYVYDEQEASHMIEEAAMTTRAAR